MKLSRNDMIVILIFIICVSVVVLLLFYIPRDIIHFTYALPAAAFLIIILLMNIKVFRFQAHPQWAINHMLGNINPSIYKISYDGRDIKVRINFITTLKFKAVYTQGATELIFKPDTTDEGIVAIIAIYLFPFSSFLIFPLAIFIYWKSSRFLRDVIELGMRQPPIEEVSKEKDVHALMVDTLHDGYTLTEKAFRVQKSNYLDFMLLGITTWLIASGIFIIFLYGKMEIPVVLASSFLCTSFLIVPFILYSVLKLRPMMLEFRLWRDRLWNLWQMELNGQVGPETTIIDTLLDLGSKIPKWIESLRPTYGIRGFITWLSMIVLIYIALMMLNSMDWGANIQDGLGWIQFLVAVLMIVLASLLFIWWMMNEQAEKERTVIQLNERMAYLEREMESIFD